MAAEAVFLLSGPSAAGKSTVGRRLAERFPRGAYVEGDFFRRSLVGGRREMEPDASPEALEQLRLRYRLAAAAADGYFQAGFAVVLEDVVAGPLLPEYAAMIKSRPLHVVVLLPRLETIAVRERERAAGGYERFSLEQLYSLFVEETPRIGVWVDTSDQSPDETVDEILARTGIA